MHNLKSKLKDVRKQVIAAEKEAKRYDFYDDVVSVTDLRTSAEVLFVGETTTFPQVKRAVATVSSARKTKDLEGLHGQGRQFDRIFISKHAVLKEETIQRAVQILAKGGLLCFFSDAEELQGAFIEIIESNWPTAEIWICDSNVGPVVMTNATGAPGWQS